MNRTRALVAGLVLALAIAAPVAAQTTIPETITVNATMAVSGLPVSIDYGATDAGAASATIPATATIVANVTWTVTIGGTAFSGSGFPASARQCKLTVVSGPAGIGGGADSWHDFGTLNFCDGVSTPASGLSAGTTVLRTDLRVNVPGTGVAGAHTGTVTFTFTAGS